jgi:hypothetical protein
MAASRFGLPFPIVQANVAQGNQVVFHRLQASEIHAASRQGGADARIPALRFTGQP